MSKKSLQILQPKQIEFIELYRENRHIGDCMRAIGYSRQTYYDWLNNDDNFALALAEAEEEINDDMKKALIDHAGGGSLQAVKFWLSNKHPEFKRENTGPNVNVQINTIIANKRKEYAI